jgi:hypothetical protein
VNGKPRGPLDYPSDADVATAGPVLQQRLVNPGGPIGSRVFIVDANDQRCKLPKFIGPEISDTVDVSELP